MAISDSTLTVDVYGAVRTFLLATAPYVTNTTSATTTAAVVNAAYNDKQPQKPQLIINPATYTESNFKFDNSRIGHGRKFINVTVDCYAGTSLGTDQLHDQIRDALADYSFDGMELVALSSDQAFINPNLNKYHLKSIIFTFDRE